MKWCKECIATANHILKIINISIHCEERRTIIQIIIIWNIFSAGKFDSIRFRSLKRVKLWPISLSEIPIYLLSYKLFAIVCPVRWASPRRSSISVNSIKQVDENAYLVGSRHFQNCVFLSQGRRTITCPRHRPTSNRDLKISARRVSRPSRSFAIQKFRQAPQQNRNARLLSKCRCQNTSRNWDTKILFTSAPNQIKHVQIT